MLTVQTTLTLKEMNALKHVVPIAVRSQCRFTTVRVLTSAPVGKVIWSLPKHVWCVTQNSTKTTNLCVLMSVQLIFLISS